MDLMKFIRRTSMDSDKMKEALYEMASSSGGGSAADTSFDDTGTQFVSGDENVQDALADLDTAAKTINQAVLNILNNFTGYAHFGVNVAHGNHVTVTGFTVESDIMFILKVATTAGAITGLSVVPISDINDLGTGFIEFVATDFGSDDGIFVAWTEP